MSSISRGSPPVMTACICRSFSRLFCAISSVTGYISFTVRGAGSLRLNSMFMGMYPSFQGSQGRTSMRSPSARSVRKKSG